FPGFSSIPLWMLLFWGMILRGLTSLCQWHRIGLDQPRNEVRLGWTNANSWVLKLVLQLALVLVTRQFIYRLYLDPLLSWMPFAVALVLFVLLFGINRQERRIVLIMAIVGPLVEVLYIQVGHLHAYHHGWIGGVPLWIALWWVVGILIWSDLSRRTLRMMRSYESSSSAGTPVRILAP
ncbi:MAG: DUF2878 family protein, partial [Proteobacteria bacterium]|nr:DUF2878 family protein [Pseudomonadota bacterium]